jgi:hypothetical protein
MSHDFSDRLNSRIASHEAAHPDMTALAEENNLTVDHTGGGCLAYALHERDGWYFWLTSGDGASLPNSILEEDCFGGWYAPDGDFWTCIAGIPAHILSVLWTLGNVSRTVWVVKGTSLNVDDITLKGLLGLAREYQAVHPDEAEAVARIIGEG